MRGYWKIVGWVGMVLVVAGAARGGEAAGDEQVVRRVADGVVSRTTRRLVDRETKETFEGSEGLAVKASIGVESSFIGWSYQNLLVLEGMTRLGAVVDGPGYREYAAGNMGFLARNMDYFRRQRDAGMKTGPVGLYFAWNALWETGLAPVWIDRYRETKEAGYRDYTDRFARQVDGWPRLKDGTLVTRDGMVRVDDAYLIIPGILRLGALSGDGARMDDGAAQMVAYHRMLFDAKDRAYRHAWSVKNNKFVGHYWGRGNGWMALAHVDVLGHLPAGHPRRGEVLAGYREQMMGVKTWQAEGGGWRQVLDRPDAWVETSCTGMFVYALARGVNEGWLDGSYAETARLGWAALKGKVAANGDIRDVCPGTGQSESVEKYLNRPRATNDPHGYGPFLLAGAEMLRLERGSVVK